MIHRKTLFIAAVLAVSMIALKGCIFKNAKQAPVNLTHVPREHVEDEHLIAPKVEQKLVSQVTAELVPSPEANSGFSVGVGKARDNNRNYDNASGQIFLAQRTGRLSTVEAVVSPGRVENPAPLVVAVLEIKGGIPGAVIATSSVRFEDIDPDHASLTSIPTNYDFTIQASFSKEAPVLKAGAHYALRFSSSESPANYRIIGCKDPLDPYPDGVKFRSRNSPEHWLSSGASGDLYFRVEVIGVEQTVEQTAESIRARPPFAIAGDINIKWDATSVYLKRTQAREVATQYQANFFHLSVPTAMVRPVRGHYSTASHDLMVAIYPLSGKSLKEYVEKEKVYLAYSDRTAKSTINNGEAITMVTKARGKTKGPKPSSGTVYSKECHFYKQYSDNVLSITYHSYDILMELSQEKRDVAINHIRETLDSIKVNGKSLNRTSEIMDPVGDR